MRLLVTGGAGFIGANFTHRALAAGNQVTVYDALTYAGNPDNLSGLEGCEGYRFVHADVRDAAALSEEMAECDAVVHFAAESHVDRSIADSAPFVSTNCGGTAAVCESALRVGVDRVVHASTDEVYGSVEKGSSAEGDRLVPSSPYAASKAASDLIALAYHHTYGLPVLITRSSNNYGPLQYPEKIIPLFITNLLEGRPIPVYGDGGNVRDWCHVDDNCDAIDLVLRTGEPGTIYNVGAGNELTNLELVDRLLGLCAADPSLVEMVDDRPGHDRRYSVDAARVRALGWSPCRSIDDGLEATVDWYRDNRWWWEPLRDTPSDQ